MLCETPHSEETISCNYAHCAPTAEVEDQGMQVSFVMLIPWGGDGGGAWGPSEEPNTGVNPMVEMISKAPTMCSFLFDSVYS